MYKGFAQATGVPFYLVLLMTTTSIVWALTCDELQCLNGNPCLALLTPDNQTLARCVCDGKWVGTRCQNVLSLQPQIVTSSEVRLKLEVVTSPGVKKTSAGKGKSRAEETSSSVMSLVSPEDGDEDKARLNYTLVYWTRNDSASLAAIEGSGEVTCVLLHRKHSRRPTLGGLKPQTRYTICVENGFIDSCVLSSFAEVSSLSSFVTTSRFGPSSSWPSNCVMIFTPGASSSPLAGVDVITKSSAVTFVAVASVFILVVLIAVFVAFLVRRQSLAFRLCTDSALHACCPCCLRGACWCRLCDASSSCSSACCRKRGSSLDTSSLNANLNASSSVVSHPQPRLSGGSSGASFLDDDLGEGREARSPSVLGRLLSAGRKRKGKRPPKSSSYASAANILLPPRPASLVDAFSGCDDNGDVQAPLDPDLDLDHDGEDSVFENNPEECWPSAAPLPATIHRTGVSTPRHRLSRKRRGYVAYLSKKGKNIRLTTVMETPVDDDAGDVGLTGMGEAEDGGSLRLPS